MTIPFEDGHTRQLPVLTTAPVPLRDLGWSYLDGARPYTERPAEAGRHLRLGDQPDVPGRRHRRLPARGVHRGPRREAASEIRGCLDRGAIVQIDFTEARLSLKLDPSGGLLGAFVDLNNRVLDGLSDEERARVGVHSCPGGDQDSTHSADVDYAALLPALCRLNVGSSTSSSPSEADPEPALRASSAAARPAAGGSSSA